MKVYINDMLVKSAQAGEHFQHLTENFEILHKYNMKLNPKKCTFGVASGKLFGFPFSKRVIEVNLAEIKAIEEIHYVITSKKEVQRLTGAILGNIVIPPSREVIRRAIKCYRITNNKAEYEAVIASLELVRELGIEQIFQTWKAVQIPREENIEADALASLASVADVSNVENAIVVHLFYPALDQTKNEYEILPEDKNKSQLLRLKAAKYCLIEGNLYSKMFGGPLARCLGPSQTEYAMREVHEGHCEAANAGKLSPN
ncbi:uncharacterized protein [Nicotiana tomentosiformis]|uniref:uncharacterized protein n=1 Tax=Nicotiana tomentosiformis TaxID=4098 RepID=UPI00388C386C